MRVLVVVFPFLLFCLNQAFAKGSNKTETKKSSRTTRANFTGTTVSGQYVHSPEANVQIEKEKSLINLVKPRTRLALQNQMTEEDLK